VIKPKMERVEFQEIKCDFSNLINKAIDNIEVINLEKTKKYSIFEKMKISGNYEI